MPRQPEMSIEQIANALGRYPVKAFVFVQECIGTAAAQVHGSMEPDEKAVHEWMIRNEADLDELRRRDAEQGLPPDIAVALERVGGPDRMNRHVTGEQLCWAVRDEALQRWGLMARGVLAGWGITRTEDIGSIIFALVEAKWLQKQPSDSIRDFDDVFSFDEVFDQSYQFGD